MQFSLAAKKLGLICLVFFSLSFQLAAQAGHKITSSFGIEFSLPTSWRLFTAEELTAAKLSNPSLEQGQTEIIVNTASLNTNSSLLDNLVLSLSSYQVPTQARQIKNACEKLLPNLLAKGQQPVELLRCQASKIQGKPALMLSYNSSSQNTTQVLQYLIQLKPNQSLNATLTFQTENSSSAAAFEAAMMKLKVLP